MSERTLVVSATNLLARGFLRRADRSHVARRRAGQRAVRGRARDPARDRVQAPGARGRRDRGRTRAGLCAGDPRGAARAAARAARGARDARRRGARRGPRRRVVRARRARRGRRRDHRRRRQALRAARRAIACGGTTRTRTPATRRRSCRSGSASRPAQVAEWLALVGDEDALPGVAGIGAKGATTLLDDLRLDRRRARRALDDDQGPPRQRAARRRATEVADASSRVPGSTARARCRSRSPRSPYREPDRDRAQRAATTGSGSPSCWSPTARRSASRSARPPRRAAALARLGAGPIAIHALIEDPAPVRSRSPASRSPAERRGVLRAGGERRVAATLVPWLEDATRAEARPRPRRHDRRAAPRGHRARAAIVGDSACASHLTQPSNWAPHDLPLVAQARARPRAARGGRGARRRAEAQGVERAAGRARRGCRGPSPPTRRRAIWRALVARDRRRARSPSTSRCPTRSCGWSCTGLIVEPAALDRAEQAFAEIEAELTAQIEALAGHPFNINSTKQLGAVLFEELKLPIASHTKTGWSTSTEALEKIEHAHPIVPLVIRWRLLRRLRDSWVDRAAALHRRRRPRPLALPPGALVLGRSSSTRTPISARVPGRTPEMAMIRRAFVAPPGRLLMSVDFNQLGLHVLAHLTKDPGARRAAAPPRRHAPAHRVRGAREARRCDHRSRSASSARSSTSRRSPARARARSRSSSAISAAEAKEYIARFDRRYAQVRAFQDEQLRLARERGYIVTIAGRRWPIGGLESLDPHDRSLRRAPRAPRDARGLGRRRRRVAPCSTPIARCAARASATVPVLQIARRGAVRGARGRARDRGARRERARCGTRSQLEVPLVVGVEAGRNWADLEPGSSSDSGGLPSFARMTRCDG